MQPARDLYDQIVEPELVTAQTIFDNTTTLSSTDGMFDQYSDFGYFPVLLFLFFGLFPGHLNMNTLRVMPDKARILP